MANEYLTLTEVGSLWSLVCREVGREDEPNYRFLMSWHRSEAEAEAKARAMGLPVLVRDFVDQQ